MLKSPALACKSFNIHILCTLIRSLVCFYCTLEAEWDLFALTHLQECIPQRDSKSLLLWSLRFRFIFVSWAPPLHQIEIINLSDIWAAVLAGCEFEVWSWVFFLCKRQHPVNPIWWFLITLLLQRIHLLLSPWTWLQTQLNFSIIKKKKSLILQINPLHFLILSCNTLAYNTTEICSI